MNKFNSLAAGLLIFVSISASALSPSAENFPPKYLGSAEKNVLSEASLDAYIRRFNRHVKTGADVEKELFGKLSAKERKDVHAIYANLGPAPTLSRKGNTLIFKFEKSELKVRWPDLTKNQVYIEGESWVFDPSAPIKMQVDNLNEKVKAGARKAEESAFNFHIIPEAHAVVPALVAACVASTACTWAVAGVGGAVIGTWGGKIAGVITGTAYDVSCWGMSEAGMKPWNSIGWCRDWKTADEEWRKKASAEAIVKDPNLEWVAGNPKCPPKDDKGVEVFDSYMAEIRKKENGDWPEQANWSRFLAKTIDGNITEGYLFDTVQNASFDTADRAHMKFTFSKDKDPVLLSVAFRKPDGSYTTILTTDQPSDIPIAYRDEMMKMKALIEAAKAWAKTCRTLARAAKVSPASADAASRVMQRQEVAPGAAGSLTPPPTTK